MLYWMLGVIIFLLCFTAVGSAIPENQEGKDLGVILFGIILNIIIAVVLGAAYYFTQNYA